MKNKTIKYELSTRPDVESYLTKIINKLESVDVLNYYSNQILAINFLNKKGAGTIHAFEYAKLFVNPTKTVLIYCTDSDNPQILEELNYIHTNYWFAMGTTKSFIKNNKFSLMICRNEKNLSEENNYGSVKKNVLFYPGAFNEDNYLDLVISKGTTYEEIADAFEAYLSKFECYFKTLSWKHQTVTDILEFVLQIKVEADSKENISRRYVGSKISGKVLELSYGNKIRIYIGPKNADYIMRTYGEEILENENQIITIDIFNNSVIKIYQTNAPQTKSSSFHLIDVFDNFYD